MPKNFNKCIATKGLKKITKPLPSNKYIGKEKELPNSGLLSKR